jgi:carbonic anhydrase
MILTEEHYVLTEEHYILTKEHYILGQKMSQCHFVHRKSHRERNFGIRGERATATVQFWLPETWKAFKICGQDGLGIRLARVTYNYCLCKSIYHLR